MTIEELGSLGELIAAVATVATLGYLALQIRRSNAIASAEAQRSASAAPATIAIAEDADLARIFSQGLQDRASLSPDEVIRFDLIFGNLMGSFASALVDQLTFGTYRKDSVADQGHNVRIFLSTPGGADWWKVHHGTLAPAFQRFVEKNVVRNPSSAA